MDVSRWTALARRNPALSAVQRFTNQCVCLVSIVGIGIAANGQTSPTLMDPSLRVKPAISGLELPTGMVFTGRREALVTEKNSGRVKRIRFGVGNRPIASVALDLAVNNSSERGLLGIALDPAFQRNHFVYLYWTCRAPHPADQFFPSMTVCPDLPEFGDDSSDILEVPLIGNRLDRFVWNGSTLTFDRNLIKLRVFQNDGAPTPPNQGDETEPPHGNHDGGKIAFGPDGKLYLFIGDVGRRGQMQNLPSGPTDTGLGATVPDDQFGGPEPDNAHFTGVVIRLNSDGSTPSDNPFFGVGASMASEVGANVQRIFSYGHRNSFGLAFDPLSGNLWNAEPGDDSFDEINRISAGSNGGWVQIMGPVSRIDQFKAIETSPDRFGLQQLRWPPTRIANSPAEALARLFMLPGSHYEDPEFSWKYAVSPAGLGFIKGHALGDQYFGAFLVGSATPDETSGSIYVFRLTADRMHLALTDARLADLVADNTADNLLLESESILFGLHFGIVTDFVTGPAGNVFIVSLDQGTIYEVEKKR